MNVNYPYLADGRRPAGTVWTSVGAQELVRPTYTPSGGDTFAVGGELCEPGAEGCRPETRRDADYAALEQGNVTVTPITLDRTYRGAAARRLERFVRTGR